MSVLGAASTVTPGDCISTMQKILGELEQLAGQAAVHRKKFEYGVNQFRRFLVSFKNSTTIERFSPEQVNANRTFQQLLRELRDLICQHQLHCWAHPTLENPSNYVASTLTDIAGKLRKAGEVLSPESAKFFDPDAPQWLQYHLLDLKGIAASFKQYLAGDPDEEVAELMTERLESVDAFITKYEHETVAPGMRVFSPIPVNYQSWRLNHEDLQEVKEIGSGMSAHVFYGFDKRDGKEVAIKKLKFAKLSGGELQAFQREVAVLATARHPTLLGFVGATDTPPFCIVTEWMAGGPLYHEIHKHKRLDPTMRTIVALDIARGMQFLHSKHIIHRDLKSLNVLLDGSGHAKICDFGFSRTADDENQIMTQNVGTPHWMAPELLTSNKSYTYKVDVYAYGIVLWEIAAGKLPYSGMDSTQIIAQVLMENLRPVVPNHVNPKLRDLMVQCWDRDPDVRPTFDEIVRRIVKDRIMLEGADAAQFEKYIADNIGVSDLGQDLETRLEGDSCQNESALLDLIETLERDEIPVDLAPKCWSIVENNSNACPCTMGRAASLFLGTTERVKAAAVLRKLPPNSVPKNVMAKAVEALPTGIEELDRDLVIAACKNNAADVAAVYALLPSHIQLALEVISQHGVALTLKAAVADKCVQCLGSKDPAMICAAMRCLVGIGEAKRISVNLIKHSMTSENESVKNCGLIAGAAVALAGINLPEDMIDIALAMDEDKLRGTFLLAICHDPRGALHVVSRLAFKENCDPVLALKVLLISVRYEEVRPAIAVALTQLDLSAVKDRYSAEIEKLSALVNV